MEAQPTASGRRGRLWGSLCLAVALAAAAVLSLQHLGAPGLPGCGLDSPCQRALSGPFGSLPWVDWPLAFAGLAFFAGLLAAWGLGRGEWSSSLRVVTRLGGLASLALLGLAFQQGTPCPFCIAAQLGNLGFVFSVERARIVQRARRAEVGSLVTALVVTAGLAVLHVRAGRANEAQEERALAESTAALSAPGLDAAEGTRAFTGRYHQGPQPASIRLVLFTDYQCDDCARIEAEAWALAVERTDLSLSIKHYPLCKDCNRRAQERNANPHPNACWAARAAEAAGMLAGDEGFWRMHRWLFERKGAFVDSELRSGLQLLGLPQGPFLELLHGQETLERVRADVDEALALGILSTPMVFVNGVELRGWNAPSALRRVVESVAARAPAAAGPEGDRPVGAVEKGLRDWLLEPHIHVPPRAGEPSLRGTPRVVLWGDYLDGDTRELDRRLRAFQATHPEISISFRHYPVDPSCVPSAPNVHPGACRAAFAAEAARALGGSEAFERMHAWLMSGSTTFDDRRLREGAEAAGFDPDALMGRLAAEDIRLRVRADVESARKLGIQSIPLLYVNDRLVPRWRIDGGDLLERILEHRLDAR